MRKVPDIRFFDFNFNLLHVENEFTCSSWTVYYNDIGTFEAHFDVKSDVLPIVMENSYLVAVQGNLSAIITGKKLTDELVIYGRTCNWLLTKRITDAFASTNEAIADLICTKVCEAFSDSPIDTISISSEASEIAVNRDDKCETFSLVQESLQLEGLGHRLEFVPECSKWIFRILKGNENNPLVISTINQNAYDVSFESDSLKLCTEGLYKNNTQSEEGTNETWETISDTPQKSGILRWQGLLSAKSESEAYAELYNTKTTNKIIAKTINLCFGNEAEYENDTCDYTLGDVISVEWQIGNYKKRLRKRIVGVNLWFEPENIGEEPVLEDIE